MIFSKFSTFAAAFSLLGVMASSSVTASDEVALVGAKVGEWTMDFDAGAKLAKEKGLPMMLNFTGSDWCGWCKLMDKNVFAGEAWKAYAKENAVLVTIDFPRDPLVVPKAYQQRNNELKSKFGIRGYPTYIVLDSDAETVLGQLSAGQEKTPESFIEEFKSAIQLSESNIAAYVAANPDKAEGYQAAIKNFRTLQDDLKAWIQTGPQRNEENTKKYEGFIAKLKEADEKLKTFQ